MVAKKITILDGARTEDKHLASILNLLKDILKKQGVEIQLFSLQNLKINQCIGCFNCWIKTPGKCIHTTDAGADILRSVLSSDILILFSPVVFGGYSSELKKILDRFLPIALPFFEKKNNELHHPRRYTAFPHIIGIGVHPAPTKELTNCSKVLTGRNAVNINTSYRAEVISNSAAPESLRRQFQKMFSEVDVLPRVDNLKALLATAASPPSISVGNRRALLIIGSPKGKMPSTSSVLGGYLLDKLKAYGWQTESLVLQEKLLRKENQDIIIQSFKKADTVLAAFPLYLDTLPAQVTKAFEIISSSKESANDKRPKNFLAIVNGGLPESYQNAVALAICRFFSQECDMTWVGGLAMGAGEQLISGNPLKGFRGFRGAKRPPLFHIARSLDITAAALAAGRPVPEKAIHMLAKKPFPLLSFNLWCWFLIKKTNSMLTKEANKNGVKKKAMYNKPYSQE